MTIKLVTALRDGAWITRERIRIYSLMMVGALIGAVLYIALTSHGLNDYKGRPLGVDFSNVYAAGTYAKEGHAAAAFVAPLQFIREQQIFGANTQFYGWHYPPIFLLLAAPLAHLPYSGAVAVWLLLTLIFYCCSMGRILPAQEVLLPALGFTAVWVNMLNGNNGFLTAALFGGALAILPTRPILAGIFFGCLAYKPQYGVLIPLALMAGHYWRATLFAALTVIALMATSLFYFGMEPWDAFFANADFTRTVVLEQGGTGFYKMQSLFAWLRYLGADVKIAYTAQGILTLVVIYKILGLWRSKIVYELKAAALIIGTLLITPYSLDYDLMVLAPALALMLRYSQREGFLPYEKTLLFAAAVVPIAARNVAQHTYIFPGVIIAMLLLLTVLRHAQNAPQEYGKSPA